MEPADDLETKLLEIEAKRHSATKKECFGELFDWLVGARLKKGMPASREESHRLLEEVSREFYELAQTKNWVPRVQTRRYKIYSEAIHGVEARRLNALNRDVFRLATVEEMTRTYWADRIAKWKLTFLKTNKTGSESNATIHREGAAASAGSGRRRGPLPKTPHQKIATIVEKRGTAWREDSSLESICEELQQQSVPLPVAWAKWKPKPHSWTRALDHRRRLVIKQLEYCIGMAHRG